MEKFLLHPATIGGIGIVLLTIASPKFNEEPKDYLKFAEVVGGLLLGYFCIFIGCVVLDGFGLFAVIGCSLVSCSFFKGNRPLQVLSVIFWLVLSYGFAGEIAKAMLSVCK